MAGRVSGAVSAGRERAAPLVAWAARDATMDANPAEVAAIYRVPFTDLDRPGSPEFVAIAEASAAKGTTLAVVPLRVLAEEGGVLDQLDARGFDIAGPPWK